jgi:hypothetical protein
MYDGATLSESVRGAHGFAVRWLGPEMVELNGQFDRNGAKDSPIAMTPDYLETVIVRA